MRVVKTALVISSAVLFSIACSTTETTNHNANQSGASNANAGANASAVSAPVPASPSANANPAAPSSASAANANQPAKTADTKSAAAAKPASNIDAAALFTSNKCATCHGAEGKGKVKGAPDFTDAGWQKKEKDAELAETIKKGKKPMPPYAGKLNDDEIKALVAYVRSFGKK